MDRVEEGSLAPENKEKKKAYLAKNPATKARGDDHNFDYRRKYADVKGRRAQGAADLPSTPKSVAHIKPTVSGGDHDIRAQKAPANRRTFSSLWNKGLPAKPKPGQTANIKVEH